MLNDTAFRGKFPAPAGKKQAVTSGETTEFLGFFFFVRGRHEKWVGLIKGSIRKAHTSSRVASPWQGWCPFGRKEENHRITNFLESPVIYWSFVY